MTETDKKLAIGLMAIMVIAGIAGGIDHWNTPNGITRNITLLYLPCIAVWFGRRLENPIHAIGLPALLGLVLMLPTMTVFTKHSRAEPMFILAVTVVAPALIAAASRAHKSFMNNRTKDLNLEALRRSASKTRLYSVIGIILFPQLTMPALLDTAQTLQTKAAQFDNDAQIIAPIKTVKLIAKIVLGLIALSGIFSTFMATIDAIT